MFANAFVLKRIEELETRLVAIEAKLSQQSRESPSADHRPTREAPQCLSAGWRPTGYGFEHVLGDWVDMSRPGIPAVAWAAGGSRVGAFTSATTAMRALDAKRSVYRKGDPGPVAVSARPAQTTADEVARLRKALRLFRPCIPGRWHDTITVTPSNLGGSMWFVNLNVRNSVGDPETGVIQYYRSREDAERRRDEIVALLEGVSQ